MNPIIAFNGLWISLPWATWKRYELRQPEQQGQFNFSNEGERKFTYQKKGPGRCHSWSDHWFTHPKAFLSTRSHRVTYKKPTSNSGKAAAGCLSYLRRHKAASPGHRGTILSLLGKFLAESVPDLPDHFLSTLTQGKGEAGVEWGIFFQWKPAPGSVCTSHETTATPTNFNWNLLQFSVTK